MFKQKKIWPVAGSKSNFRSQDSATGDFEPDPDSETELLEDVNKYEKRLVNMFWCFLKMKNGIFRKNSGF
jgi:hypothetical protein